jgi:hypothetical protein
VRLLFLARNETLLACLRSFWPISGHFHSNPNFVDLPMTPLSALLYGFTGFAVRYYLKISVAIWPDIKKYGGSNRRTRQFEAATRQARRKRWA